MRTKGQTHTYILPELEVKLFNASGESVDSAHAYDLGVTVTFDYDYETEDDAAQAHVRSVKSAGAALDGQDATLNLWAGCELLPYLPQPEIDAIAEAMVAWMKEVIADDNDASLIHANT